MRVLLALIIACTLYSCKGDEVYSPKPKMYPRIDYPQKVLAKKDLEFCNFAFEAPTYMDVEQEKYFYDDVVAHPCWFDIKVPSLKASMHCSYYPLKDTEELSKLVAGAFRLTSEHNKKASYISETVIDSPSKKVHGLLFDVEGPVASPVQFYLTDSTDNFFRAALYFDSKVNVDSTAPVLKYLHQDIKHIIETWEWM